MDLQNVKTKNGGVISLHKKRGTNTWITNLWDDSWKEINSLDIANEFERASKLFKQGYKLEAEQIVLQVREMGMVGTSTPKVENTTEENMTGGPTIEEVHVETEEEKAQRIKELKLIVSQKLLNFFSEFNFIPAARFINTLQRKLQENKTQTKAYVYNYFKLCDSPYKNNVKEKLKSDEFKMILEDLSQIPLTKEINKRFEVYYGPQGTGKSTKMIKEYPNCPVIVCNSTTLPDDLMQVFDFNDENGNPVFKKSELRLGMENGYAVGLDEINLLGLDSLRFLQGLIDDKSSINYKGDKIEIKEGFKIIGTMNLDVDGAIFSLPSPLIDRCYNIQEFEMTPQILAEIGF